MNNCLKCDCDCSVFMYEGARFMKCYNCDFLFKENDDCLVIENEYDAHNQKNDVLIFNNGIMIDTVMSHGGEIIIEAEW